MLHKSAPYLKVLLTMLHWGENMDSKSRSCSQSGPPLAVYQGAITHYPRYPTHTWVSIIFFSLFGTALGFTWYISTVNQIGPTFAAAVLNLAPIWSILLGAIFLGELLYAFRRPLLIGVFLTTYSA